MTILTGSLNPVKIKATRLAFKQVFETVTVSGVEVSSGVPHQPIGDETFRGAEHRALECYRSTDHPVDYTVGIEGGILKTYNRWFGLGAVCIVDRQGRKGFGTSAHFELPDAVVDELLSGEELGTVIDRLAAQTNSKQRGGAIGFLSREHITREELYRPAIVTALIPFLQADVFGMQD
jgi:inosine/xanthosine triphosphatase